MPCLYLSHTRCMYGFLSYFLLYSMGISRCRFAYSVLPNPANNKKKMPMTIYICFIHYLFKDLLRLVLPAITFSIIHKISLRKLYLAKRHVLNSRRERVPLLHSIAQNAILLNSPFNTAWHVASWFPNISIQFVQSP